MSVGANTPRQSLSVAHHSYIHSYIHSFIHDCVPNMPLPLSAMTAVVPAASRSGETTATNLPSGETAAMQPQAATTHAALAAGSAGAADALLPAAAAAAAAAASGINEGPQPKATSSRRIMAGTQTAATTQHCRQRTVCSAGSYEWAAARDSNHNTMRELIAKLVY
jgi:hypothetical protein